MNNLQPRDKSLLDEIIDKHKAQPVGSGYIDIIVSRDRYKGFVGDLLSNGIGIRCITWWEWCEGEAKNKYGMGGPKSRFYEGWFSEIPTDRDELNDVSQMAKEDIFKLIIERVESKEISLSIGMSAFDTSSWMTPAFWLDVPDEWTNKFTS